MNARRWLAVLALMCASCGPSVHVGMAHDPSFEHGGYRTFAMTQPNKPVPSSNTEVSPFVLLRLRQITYLKLKEMGYRPVPKAEAELLIDVNAARDEDIYVYGNGFAYDRFYGPMWSTRVARIQEGIVVIDLIDREKNSVVWRGTGVSAIAQSFDEEELQELVNSILVQYPPDRSATHD